MVDPQKVQHRGVQIVQVDPPLDRPVPMIICLAMDKTRLYTSTSEQRAETLLLVLPTMLDDRALSRQILAPVGAAKFSRDHDQRIFQQAAALEI